MFGPLLEVFRVAMLGEGDVEVRRGCCSGFGGVQERLGLCGGVVSLLSDSEQSVKLGYLFE
jgi:hypothetical protein